MRKHTCTPALYGYKNQQPHTTITTIFTHLNSGGARAFAHSPQTRPAEMTTPQMPHVPRVPPCLYVYNGHTRDLNVGGRTARLVASAKPNEVPENIPSFPPREEPKPKPRNDIIEEQFLCEIGCVYKYNYRYHMVSGSTRRPEGAHTHSTASLGKAATHAHAHICKSSQLHFSVTVCCG